MTDDPRARRNFPLPGLSRRRLLQSLGATVTLAGLTGCGGDSDDEGEGEDEGTNGEASEEGEAEDEDD